MRFLIAPTAILFSTILISLNSCTESGEKTGRKTPPKKSTYVEPTVNYKGQIRKGYVRKPISTDKKAVKNQNRASYYYQTRGKYRRN